MRTKIYNKINLKVVKQKTKQYLINLKGKNASISFAMLYQNFNANYIIEQIPDNISS